MIVLLKLLLAHFICDFVLKPVIDKVKGRSSVIKALVESMHLLLYGLLPFLFIGAFDFGYFALIQLMTALMANLLERRMASKYPMKRKFALDQIIRLVVLFIIWLLYSGQFTHNSQLRIPAVFWVYANAIIFLSWVSSAVIQQLMSRWFRDIQEQDVVSLRKAGTYIGILERLFVFTFVVTNHWEAIGFLVAAKSVFRFGDLQESRNRILTEYVLIGTLLSFGIALVTGLITVQLLPITP